jgi:hypothetical protein
MPTHFPACEGAIAGAGRTAVDPQSAVFTLPYYGIVRLAALRS